MTRRLALVLALTAAAAFASGASPATASAQTDTVDDVVCYVKTGDAYRCFRMGPQGTREPIEDVCVTYDFAGSEFCVLEETGEAVETARQALRDNDRCITYDFAGSEFCVVRDTIG